MRLTIEEVQHIAALARVGMTDREVCQMRDQLSHILDNFDVLNQVDTDGVDSTSQSEDLNTVARVDGATNSHDVDDMLANAPRIEDNLIRVRAVLE